MLRFSFPAIQSGASVHPFSTLSNRSLRMGFSTKSSIPTPRQMALSSSDMLAVTPMIGVCSLGQMQLPTTSPTSCSLSLQPDSTISTVVALRLEDASFSLWITLACSIWRIALVAVKPSITGICKSCMQKEHNTYVSARETSSLICLSFTDTPTLLLFPLLIFTA